jgi:hypothetical protein
MHAFSHEQLNFDGPVELDEAEVSRMMEAYNNVFDAGGNLHQEV